MNAGFLNVLHNAGDKDRLAVTHCVDFKLAAHNIFVYQHRLVYINFYCGCKIVPQAFFISDNLHCTAAEHIAGAHQHRVTDLRSDLAAVFYIGYGKAFRLRNTELIHDFFKAIAVFGIFNCLHVGADDGHAEVCKRFCQVDGSLSAQRYHNTHRLLKLKHIHNVLDGQRLKVEFVAGGVIGRNSFGVVIDDDCFIARLADCPDSVNRRIIKFDALPNANGAGAQHHNFFAVGYDRFILLLVSGVEVRHIAVKLRSAGVNHFINREDAFFFAQQENLFFVAAPNFGNILVRNAQTDVPSVLFQSPQCF